MFIGVTAGPLLEAAPILRSVGAAAIPDGTLLRVGKPVMVGFTRTLSLELENDGNTPLGNLTCAISGKRAVDFSLTILPATSLAPGEKTGITLLFRPIYGIVSSAVLTITSGEASTPALTFPLQGSSTTSFSPHFDTPADIYLEGEQFDPSGSYLGRLTLGFVPAPGTTLIAFRRTVPAPRPFTEHQPRFEGRPVTMTATYGGQAYTFLINYQAREGITLVLMRPDLIDPNFIAIAGASLSIALPPGGKILLADHWNRIPILLPDGSTDPFHNRVLETSPGFPRVLQDDGKFFGGVAALRRYHPDLDPYRYRAPDPDPSFAPSPGASHGAPLYVLKDGRILCLGEGLRLLREDGSLDPTFAAAAPSAILEVGQQPDGRLLVSYGGGSGVDGAFVEGDLSGIVRLQADGSVDPTFHSAIHSAADPGSQATVDSFIVLQDGEILAAGQGRIGGRQCGQGLHRLHADGSLDESFDASTDGRIDAILRQNGGHILIGGRFTRVNGRACNGLGRLFPDGTLDDSFTVLPVDPPSDNRVTAIAMRADGSLLVSGGGKQSSPALSHGLIRVMNAPLVSTVQVSHGSGISWRRNPEAADLMYATFELFADGASEWVMLGDGVRTPEGWRLDRPAPLPATGMIRVKGRHMTSNSSSVVTIENHLFGRAGFTAIEKWREKTFGDPANTGTAANGADPDGDGLANLIEYGLIMDPKWSQPPSFVPQWITRDGGREFIVTPFFDRPLTYGAEWTTTLRDDDWHPADVISIPGDHRKTLRVPDTAAGGGGRLFFRLKFSE